MTPKTVRHSCRPTRAQLLCPPLCPTVPERPILRSGTVPHSRAQPSTVHCALCPPLISGHSSAQPPAQVVQDPRWGAYLAPSRADLARRRETAGAIQRIRETDAREMTEESHD